MKPHRSQRNAEIRRFLSGSQRIPQIQYHFFTIGPGCQAAANVAAWLWSTMNPSEIVPRHFEHVMGSLDMIVLDLRPSK
jgi:hypothetical protein